MEESLGWDSDAVALLRQLSSSPLRTVTSLVWTKTPVLSSTLKETENVAGTSAVQIKSMPSTSGKTVTGGG